MDTYEALETKTAFVESGATKTSLQSIELGVRILTFRNSIGRYEVLMSPDIKLCDYGALIPTETGATFLIPWSEVVSVGFNSEDSLPGSW